MRRISRFRFAAILATLALAACVDPIDPGTEAPSPLEDNIEQPVSVDSICGDDWSWCETCGGGWRTGTGHYTAIKTWYGYRCEPKVTYGTCVQACAL